MPLRELRCCACADALCRAQIDVEGDIDKLKYDWDVLVDTHGLLEHKA
jgi:hypothetical protein